MILSLEIMKIDCYIKINNKKNIHTLTSLFVILSTVEGKDIPVHAMKP